MPSPNARIARPLKPAVRRRERKRSDDRGLTTLEWLLIVAAVAGLAALAVVLVQNVVSDTSEQIAGSSARRTAAQIAAQAVEDESKIYDATLDQFSSWAKWENYFTSKCNRITITYADAGISAMTVAFAKATGATDPVTDVSAATTAVAAANKPQAQCAVP